VKKPDRLGSVVESKYEGEVRQSIIDVLVRKDDVKS